MRTKEEILVEEMIEVCHQLYERRLVSSTGGNVSLRINNKVMITPRGVPLGQLAKGDIVKIDIQGNIIEEGVPSKEMELHLSLYKSYPDCKAVIHAHSSYIIAASCMIDNSKRPTIPVFSPGYAVEAGHIPVIPYYLPGSKELTVAVTNEIRGYKAIVLQNHGVVCIGENIVAAKNLVEEIEENAKIYVLTRGQGRCLTKEQIEEVRKHYPPG
jgi:ribulose-5-phosphate 4-epimerase/fuculose-1-phosphate aldolase